SWAGNWARESKVLCIKPPIKIGGAESRHMGRNRARRLLRALSLRQKLGVALGAEFVLASQVAVLGANRKSGRNSDVRQAKARKRRAHQLLAGACRRKLLAHV